MRIDPRAWRIELSAQDFAGFRSGPAAGRPAPAWRAEAGRQWHTTLRNEAESRDEGWTFEVTIETQLQAKGWT
jgi:hypothetical protein